MKTYKELKSRQFGDVKKIERVLALVVADIVLINLAQFLALYLRFEMVFSAMEESGFLYNVEVCAPFYTFATLVIFALMGLYNSLWEYIGTNETMKICAASAIAGILQFTVMTIIGFTVPRSFPILNILFLALFIGAERFSYRAILTARHRRGRLRKRTRTMLIGAGSAGAMVLRELHTSERSRNRVVCIIDDDPSKTGRRLKGVPIIGGRELIPEAVEEYNIGEIILAVPSAKPSQRRAILEICQDTGCVTRTMPAITDLANGDVTVQKIRKVDIEDLLGRDSVRVDMDAIAGYVRGKTVLVTGGGGSIGSELCRQIAQHAPKKLIIFDIYENNAYDVQQELRHKYPELDLLVLIGSVRDADKVDELFREQRPEIVYHAAAHKHVPLMEDSPNEAVKNNVFGTYNVASAADRFGARVFVLISTDKAVNPTSVMGATKRICEMIMQMFARRSQTKFAAVRFGNVLDSNGSVIPLFRRQIEHGGPVTVTHKDIIRYFMTIPEAVSLVMQAGALAKGGEIFVLDMGDPVKIDDLARKMIRLSGFEPDTEIKVDYTGLRPGEKLYEELLMNEEGLHSTAHDLIHIGRPIVMDDERFEQGLCELKTACQANSEDIRVYLEKLVPTYQPAPVPEKRVSPQPALK